MRKGQIARLECSHVAQHLRLGVMRVEDGVREEGARAREALVEAVVHVGGQHARLGRRCAPREDRE